MLNRYGRAVLSLSYGSTVNPYEAADLAQEVFLAALARPRRLPRRVALSTWLFALARNACVDARAANGSARSWLAAAQDEVVDAGGVDREGTQLTARAIGLPAALALLGVVLAGAVVGVALVIEAADTRTARRAGTVALTVPVIGRRSRRSGRGGDRPASAGIGGAAQPVNAAPRAAGSRRVCSNAASDPSTSGCAA